MRDSFNNPCLLTNPSALYRLATIASTRGAGSVRYGSGALVQQANNLQPGGFGTAVWELLSEHGNVPRILRIGLPDRYVTHGAPDRLHEEVGFTPPGEAFASELKQLCLRQLLSTLVLAHGR